MSHRASGHSTQNETSRTPSNPQDSHSKEWSERSKRPTHHAIYETEFWTRNPSIQSSGAEVAFPDNRATE